MGAIYIWGGIAAFIVIVVVFNIVADIKNTRLINEERQKAEEEALRLLVGDIADIEKKLPELQAKRLAFLLQFPLNQQVSLKGKMFLDNTEQKLAQAKILFQKNDIEATKKHRDDCLMNLNKLDSLLKFYEITYARSKPKVGLVTAIK